MHNISLEHSSRPRRVNLNSSEIKMDGSASWTSQLSNLIYLEFGRSPGPTNSYSNDDNSTPQKKPRWIYSGAPVIVALLFVLTTLSKFLDDWVHLHFLYGEKNGQLYFSKIWAKSFFIVVFLQVMPKTLSSSLQSRVSAARAKFFSLWPLLALHLVVNVAFAFDFLNTINNAAGTEFYQVSHVLSLIVLAAVVHMSSYLIIPSHVHVSLVAISGLQLMILAQDDYFYMSLTSSVYTIVVVAAGACYILRLLTDMRKESILLLVYYLNVCLVVMLPFFIIYHDTFPAGLFASFSIQSVCTGMLKIGLMAAVTLSHMVISLLFMKVTDPLACTLAWNLSSVIRTLLMALVYKRLYHVSSFKISWFLILHVFVIFGPFWKNTA